MTVGEVLDPIEDTPCTPRCMFWGGGFCIMRVVLMDLWSLGEKAQVMIVRLNEDVTVLGLW